MAIGTGWVDGAWVDAGWVVGAWSTAATAVVSGTASSGLTEAQVVAGGETIVITLTGDTWVSGAAFTSARQAIIDGLDSDKSEATGWNAEVRDKEVVGAVVRTSSTVVTITLTAAAAYNITADETITVTVPASAVVLAAPITATPTFDCTADVAISSARRRGGFPAKDKRRRVKVLEKEDYLLPFEAALLEIERQEAERESRPAVLTRERAVQIARRAVGNSPRKLSLMDPKHKLIILEEEDRIILELLSDDFL